MAGFLLDTSVLSETRKKHPNPGVVRFILEADAARLYISALTVGEFCKGIERKRLSGPDAANQIGEWADRIETDFADRILGVDIATARLRSELSGSRSAPVIDTLIAATALIHGLTVVTRNTKNFAATNVSLIDPWRDA